MFKKRSKTISQPEKQSTLLETLQITVNIRICCFSLKRCIQNEKEQSVFQTTSRNIAELEANHLKLFFKCKNKRERMKEAPSQENSDSTY